MSQQKISEQNPGSETPKRPYVRPEILLIEQLEAVAVDCSSGGKEIQGAGGCGFSQS